MKRKAIKKGSNGMKMNKICIPSLIILLIFVSCSEEEADYYPKPRGYLRMDYPERQFSTYADSCPFKFEIPDYFNILTKTGSCNKDVLISRFNATLFLTYLPVDSNLVSNIEYSRKLAYDHNIRADAIEESQLVDAERKVYGLRYNISGDAASQYQFYLTDSTTHFVRGALYFNSAPNYDSLRPSLEYVIEDIDHLIETLEWTDTVAASIGDD
jgi:gliding motility-associated lipoprotein GldD